MEDNMQMYMVNNMMLIVIGISRYLKELNIRVIRFWNNDVLQNIEGVGQKIKEEVEKHS
jgi:hypothetical protein